MRDHPLLSRKSLLASLAVATVLAASPSALAAESFQILYVFDHPSGTNPYAGLIADAQGNLYGTTQSGGRAGGGTVFELSPEGVLSVLFAFCAADNCTQGSTPSASLVQDESGNLYGTTAEGGSGAHGLVFKVSPGGSETVLYTFKGGSDGEQPMSHLLRSKSGELYGTTLLGGGKGCGGGYGCGAVYRIATDGTEKVLYRFRGHNDGQWPYAGLIADGQGNLYGTASFGGASNDGIVFEIARDGSETVLHSFADGSDGRTPVADLYRDTAGNLYGTTDNGGQFGGGIVFKLAPDGSETVIHAFGSSGDGARPDSPLIADGKGNFFGTTIVGGRGRSNDGTIFEITSGGTEKILYQLHRGRDGKNPTGSLLLSGKTLYGVTEFDISNGHGEVFALSR